METGALVKARGDGGLQTEVTAVKAEKTDAGVTRHRHGGKEASWCFGCRAKEGGKDKNDYLVSAGTSAKVRKT